jgi:uncharacterized protein YndB with AHSA1/START domain
VADRYTKLHIEKVVWIQADPTAVFDALTSSEEMVEYLPLDKVTSSWRVESELRMQGTANGQVFTDFGLIRVLDRPQAFGYTYWSDNHGTENRPEHHISIKYELKSDAGGTRVVMVQSNLPSQDYRAMMEQVWDGLLGSLKAYVESMRATC